LEISQLKRALGLAQMEISKPNVGYSDRDNGRVWPAIGRITADMGSEPNVLERIRIECSNYVIAASLLAATSAEMFASPPTDYEDGWLHWLFGVFAGLAVVAQLTTVLLSTAIMINTTQCTTPEHTAFFLSKVDDLTYPNTRCFYLGILLTPCWLAVSGMKQYGPALSLTVCGIAVVSILYIRRIFWVYAGELNTKTFRAAKELHPTDPTYL